MMLGYPAVAQPTKQRLIDQGYIYRIVVYHRGSPPKVLTGFKPEGYDGLISALHGFTSNQITGILAQTFKSTSGVRHEMKESEITIESVSIAKDLVLLKCSKLVKKGGIPLAKNYSLRDYEELIVYGYPETMQLQGSPHKTPLPNRTQLGVMLKSTPMYSVLKTRKSPQLETEVIRLPEDAIYPGHSGGPVVNQSGEVVGVANGGFLVRGQLKIGSMAVMADNKLPDERYSDKAIKVKIADVEKYPAVSLSASTDSSTPNQVISLFRFPPSKPFLTFGGTLSRPFWFFNDGIRADLDFRHTNGRFDGYAEVAIGKNWAVGGYLSSRYLQYTILRSFDLHIPLQAEQTVRQAKTLDSYGVQASYVFSRGVIHNAYVGGGFCPVLGGNNEARSTFNYRGFVGYRFYAGPRRKFGLEVRAMYVGQNILEYRWHPTLGIAHPIEVVHALTQWYICGGLTYSIYRHE